MGLKHLKLPEASVAVPGGDSFAVRGLCLDDLFRHDDLVGRSGGNGSLTRLIRGELRLQLFVLGDRLAPLDDDLIEEVVDLVGVETLLEADVLELLGDDVIRCQSHGVSSFGAHVAGLSGGSRRAGRTNSA